MLEYIKGKLQKLLESVVEPIFDWIIKGSWRVRATALAVIVSGGTAYTQPQIPLSALDFGGRAIRVVTSSNDVPLKEEVQNSIDQVRGRLKLSVENDIGQLSKGFITPWSAAQAIAALNEADRKKFDVSPVVAFIRANAAEACSCWSELPPHKQETAWLFISGWVFSALSQYGESATVKELEFVLSAQNTDGSWPSAADARSLLHESTYSTAWNIIGLQKQLTAGLIVDSRRVAVETAIRRGASWLLSTRQQKARWKLYPNISTSSASASVSGVAMHAIRLAIPDQFDAVAKEWLDNLPETIPPANIGDNTYMEIRHDQGVQIDHFVQLTMPWMLVATVDAYSSGNSIQKIRALSWIEKVVTQQSVVNADAEQNNWWRAELLVAVNYLLANIDEGAQQVRAQPSAPADRFASASLRQNGG